MNVAKILLLLVFININLACTQEFDEEASAPFTGNINFEDQDVSWLNTSNTLSVDANSEYYVVPVRLRVRSGPSTNHEILGVLSRNDKVQVLEVIEGSDFVKVEILNTNENIEPSDNYYVGKAYISAQKVVVKAPKFGSYFMIQNIATETLRVYERGCATGKCPHKLVLETSMAVGENAPGTQTKLGHYQISSWHKFYQDGAAKYPSWYDPSFPSLPDPGSSLMTWTSSDLLPNRSSASVRGAFGWYTAKVAPNASAQWTHGTLGWGSDKKKFIDVTRGFWANLVTDPRSHGCSRTDNESIALVRELLPKHATIVKIYAKEAYADSSRSNYSKQKEHWDYILTKNGVRKDGQKSDRESVLNSRTPASQWLEEGRYAIDAYPDAKPFLEDAWGYSNKDGKNGNVYGLEHSDMKGVFLVDEGRLVNYRHPAKVKKGGYRDVQFPSQIIASSQTNYTMPDCPVIERDSNDEGHNWWEEEDGQIDPRCRP